MPKSERLIAAEQAISDMEFAESRAKEAGAKPGTYDLANLTNARTEDRKQEEAAFMAQLAEMDRLQGEPIMGEPLASNGTGTSISPEMVVKETDPDKLRYKELQAKLTDYLKETNPEFEQWYEKLYNTTSAEKRDELLADMKKAVDPHLTQDKGMLEALGKDELAEFNTLKSKLIGSDASNWGKGTRGTKEAVKDGVTPPESYGIKSALHWMGATPSMEQAESNQLYYKTRQEEFDSQRTK